jgi:hypothetical protein
LRSQHSFNTRLTVLSCKRRAISALKDDEAEEVSPWAKGGGTVKSPDDVVVEMRSDSGWKEEEADYGSASRLTIQARE